MVALRELTVFDFVGGGLKIAAWEIIYKQNNYQQVVSQAGHGVDMHHC